MRILVVAAVVICLSAAAFPATYGGSLTPVNGSATITWAGGPLTGAMGYLALAESQVGLSPACDSTQCDLFNLAVDLPSNFYASYPNYSVHVTIDFGNDVQDLDLYFYDSAGKLVGASATGGLQARTPTWGSFQPATTRSR